MHADFLQYIPRSVKERVPLSWKEFVFRQVAFARSFQRREGGYCPVCGYDTLFSYNRHISEDGDCLRCLSFSRNRAIAVELLRFLDMPGCLSLPDVARISPLDIYLMSAWGSVADALRPSPCVVLSEYFDDVLPGERKNGILCQDVRKLTFPDNTFDIVISECVFEHVPEYRDGFQEVYRVLNPGGAHLFTIPYDPHVRTTERYERQGSEWVPILPVELHSDRIRGTIPAYTTFGYDLPDILAEIGFETQIVETPADIAERYCIYDGRVFVAVKRG
jgi:SAM-dependent methyltransferase